MAWKGKDKTPGKFADLLKPLMNANIQQSNNPLFQVLSQIIQRSNDEGIFFSQNIKEIVGAISEIGDTIILIRDIIENIDDVTFLLGTPVPTDPSTATFVLPNARELLAGVGITFDDSIANQRTVNSTAGASYVPLATGAEPLEIMSNGAGSVLLVAFTP